MMLTVARSSRHAVLALATLVAAGHASAQEPTGDAAREGDRAQRAGASWYHLRDVAGVPVEARPTATGFDAHRARVRVCTDLDALTAFVVDPSRFTEWVAFTRTARMLEQAEDSAVYYVRSRTPWPLRDTDMVYRIERHVADNELHLSVTGLPDYLPMEQDATRIRSAAGEWRLVPDDQGISVAYELHVDPGDVPRTLANRRLSRAVGQTLANLAAKFPCDRG